MKSLDGTDKDEVVLQMRNYSGDACQPFRIQVQATINRIINRSPI